jgi:hypothetical protein
MVHAYNPSYFGGWDQEDRSSRLAQTNSLWDFHLQNNQSKMDWKYSLSTCFASMKAWVQTPVPPK